jgi:RNA polymerase sporulation-specific sigma factor
MTDREQKIIDNMGLVHYVLHKYFPLYIDNQDNIQNGYVGLIKAVDSFDESTGNTFSTYASRCIFNEIAMDLRRRNKYAKDISLYTVLANGDTRDDPLTIEDIFIYEDDYTTLYIQEFVQCLDEREITVLRYLMAGKNQTYISNRLGMTRSNVCLIVKKMRSKWKECRYRGGNYES